MQKILGQFHFTKPQVNPYIMNMLMIPDSKSDTVKLVMSWYQVDL